MTSVRNLSMFDNNTRPFTRPLPARDERTLSRRASEPTARRPGHGSVVHALERAGLLGHPPAVRAATVSPLMSLAPQARFQAPLLHAAAGRAAPGISAPNWPPLEPALPPQRPVNDAHTPGSRSMTSPASEESSAQPALPSASEQALARRATRDGVMIPLHQYAVAFGNAVPTPIRQIGAVGLGLAAALPKLAVGPMLGALSGAYRGLLIASFEADPHVGQFRGWNVAYFLPLAVIVNAIAGFKYGMAWGAEAVSEALVAPFRGAVA